MAYCCDVDKLRMFTNKLEVALFDITTSHIRSCIQHHVKSGISLNTHHRLIKSFRAFYKFLEYSEYITDNPTANLSYPKSPQLIPQVLHLEEINSLLYACNIKTDQGLRDRAIMETLYATGIRASELCHFLVSSYYPSDHFIRVIGKGNKERSIPIGESAIKWINTYIRLVRNKMTYMDMGHEHIMFLKPNGKRYNRSNIATIVNRLATLANLKKKITPHTLRHSFATHLIEGGASLNAVSAMLGHVSITSTEIYVKMNIENLRDTLECYHPRSRMMF